METIGQRLKAAREQKGLSQSDLARSIKIKTSYVAALENDRFHELIAPIYAKGFIKLYAKVVGLDPAPFLRQFAGLEVFTGEIVRKKREAPAKREAPKRPQRKFLAGLTDSIRKIKLPEMNLPKTPFPKPAATPFKIWMALLVAAALCLAVMPFLRRSTSTPAPEIKIRLPPECRWIADPPEPYLDIAPDRKP